MRLVPAAELSTAELAELFTRGYEGYAVPLRFDEQAMAFILDAWDIDVSKSRVALDGDERVGIANLGVRAGRSWVGGLGVVPAARRRGIGRLLMEALIEEAPASLTLEVLEQNESAIRLYESLGFDRTRILEVWSVPETPHVEARPAEAAPLGQSGLPWQREDGSLPPGYERVEVDGGAMLFRGTSVLQLAADDEDAAVALLSRGTALSYVNVPEGDVASGALRRLGGDLTLRQFEMALRR